MPRAFFSRLLTASLVVVSLNLDLSHSIGSIPLCQSGLEFWSADNYSCAPCTKCAPEFTISPCDIYRDAVCGPLSALELDWPFIGNKKKSNVNQRFDDIESKMLGQFSQFEKNPESLKKLSTNQQLNAMNKMTEETDKETQILSRKLMISEDFMEKNKLKSNESNHLQWDWQTTALVLAVCACIIFFLVAGCSALVYVRQWRRMKRNFEPAGLEEISARLNLMVKAELAELSSGAPMSPGDPEMRCHYLEKLLDRKRETPMVAGWPETRGNLYIEEGETSCKSQRGQLARIHRNIENILTYKSSLSSSSSSSTSTSTSANINANNKSTNASIQND